MRETIWRYQLYEDGRFEPLLNSGRSFTWAYKLKALKSSFDYNLKEDKKQLQFERGQKLWKEVTDDKVKYEETTTELKKNVKSGKVNRFLVLEIIFWFKQDAVLRNPLHFVFFQIVWKVWFLENSSNTLY